MSSLTDAAIVAGITATLTAGLAYASNRFSSRRSAVADALVDALQDGQRSTFFRDLRSHDHYLLVAEPVESWAGAVRAGVSQALDGADGGDAEARPSSSDVVGKFEDVLSWRMQEREARIRFAVIARAGDIRAFADFHRARDDEAVRSGRKTREPLDRALEATTESLVTELPSGRRLVLGGSLRHPIGDRAVPRWQCHGSCLRPSRVRLLAVTALGPR